MPQSNHNKLRKTPKRGPKKPEEISRLKKQVILKLRGGCSYSKAAEQFSVNLESLETARNWQNQNARLSEAEMENAFELVYTTIEQLALIVDKLEV